MSLRGTPSWSVRRSGDTLFLRKVWVSIKFLSAKFCFTHTPPRRAQNEKNCTNQKKILETDTFPGGVTTQFCGQNDFIWAFLIFASNPFPPPVWREQLEKKRSRYDSGNFYGIETPCRFPPQSGIVWGNGAFLNLGAMG